MESLRAGVTPVTPPVMLNADKEFLAQKVAPHRSGPPAPSRAPCTST
jgi:hypothetical protein